jgi:tetratricopeptide (TPR) repeat protein
MSAQHLSWGLLRVLPALVVLGMTSGCSLLKLGGGGDSKGPERLSGGTLQEQLAAARVQTALEPAEPYWPYRLGELHYGASHPDSAEISLRAALRRDPYYVPALSLLSKIYFDSGRHEAAIEMLEAARAHPERFPSGVPSALLEGLALHYDALDQIGPAADVLRQAGGRSGSPRVYLTLRGEAPQAAGDMADQALKSDPKSAVNLNNYGITRLRAGDPEAAEKAFLAAVDRDPHLPGPYYNLAILEKYYRFDDEAAAGWLKKYRERSTFDPDGLFEVLGASAGTAAKAKE